MEGTPGLVKMYGLSTGSGRLRFGECPTHREWLFEERIKVNMAETRNTKYVKYKICKRILHTIKK